MKKIELLKEILEEAQFDASRHKVEVYSKWADFMQAWVDGTLKLFNEELADNTGNIPVYIDGEESGYFKSSHSRLLEVVSTIEYMQNLIVDNYTSKIEIGYYELKG